MTGPADLYKYRALLLPWTVRGLDELAGILLGSFAITTSWHDGDTFNAFVSRGDHDYGIRHVRTAGYNAPELKTGDPGKVATDYARSLVDTGGLVYMDSLAFVKTDENDDFGRVLAAVTLSDGRDLAPLMLANTGAVPD